jgi:beta-glucosidase
LQLDKQTIYPGDELSISFSLTNTGRYDSDEVVQVYANFTGSRVERPLLSLKGFQRVHVKKGETKKVTIPVKAEDLMYWDVKERSFVLEPGQVEFWIGAASDDIRLVGQVMANQ